MCNQGDAVGSTWIWNFQPMRRRYVTRTSDDVRQASLCARPMAEQIWVLVQARYHLLAETLRRKMVDYQICCSQRQTVTKAVHAAKTEYYRSEVQRNAKDTKLLFKMIDGLHRSDVSPLALADKFQDFFMENLTLSWQGLQTISVGADPSEPHWNPGELPAGCFLISIQPGTQAEVLKLLIQVPTKSCELDSMPICLLKRCGDCIIPAVTNVINMPLTQGVVPICLKKAHVQPLPKRFILDADSLKNYRLVSNLPFLSKQTVWVVASLLTGYLTNFDPAEPCQSPYKAKHSCETTLLRVQNDILRSMNEGKVGVLLLLDLFSAIDRVDHGVSVDRLQEELGIGTVLDWFTFYLANRCQVVTICGEKFKSCQLHGLWYTARISSGASALRGLHHAARYTEGLQPKVPFPCRRLLTLRVWGASSDTSGRMCGWAWALL